jgi:muramidase (phage lysozyme)
MPRLETTPNLAAFLDTIAHSEGTAGRGDDGYNVLVGGTLTIAGIATTIEHRLFGDPPDCYRDHPRELVTLRPGLKSTAAGRYQVLAHIFDAYKDTLHLCDFSPAAQDAIALQQIRECKAIPAIEAGDFATAVGLCAHIWASLPGNDYGQHQNSIETLQAAYTAAGGTLTA